MSLKTENIGRVRKLTLNRPEQLNAFNNEQYAGVRDALKQTEEDSRHRCCRDNRRRPGVLRRSRLGGNAAV